MHQCPGSFLVRGPMTETSTGPVYSPPPADYYLAVYVALRCLVQYGPPSVRRLLLPTCGLVDRSGTHVQGRGELATAASEHVDSECRAPLACPAPRGRPPAAGHRVRGHPDGRAHALANGLPRPPAPPGRSRRLPPPPHPFNNAQAATDAVSGR